MKIGILGSGAVGQAMAKGFIAEGHDVWLATREPNGDKAGELQANVSGATISDFATAAREAELAIFCVKWDGAAEMIDLIGPDNLRGKVVIETSNIIKQVGDALVYGGTDTSAAEQVQAWLPDSYVVKAFNTVGAALMYKPALSETPTMFMAGDDADAKQHVADIITTFGWQPLDSGPLIGARELEAMAVVWIRNAMTSEGVHAFKML